MCQLIYNNIHVMSTKKPYHVSIITRTCYISDTEHNRRTSAMRRRILWGLSLVSYCCMRNRGRPPIQPVRVVGFSL